MRARTELIAAALALALAACSDHGMVLASASGVDAGADAGSDAGLDADADVDGALDDAAPFPDDAEDAPFPTDADAGSDVD